jgi:hypothetical protein
MPKVRQDISQCGPIDPNGQIAQLIEGRPRHPWLSPQVYLQTQQESRKYLSINSLTLFMLARNELVLFDAATRDPKMLNYFWSGTYMATAQPNAGLQAPLIAAAT